MAQEMQMMKEKMDVMMSALKGQVSTNLDEIVQLTDPPFIEQVTSFPLSTKFKMPQVEAYDGLRNPLDHLESFKTLMHLQGFLDEIMCRVFPTTLKGLPYHTEAANKGLVQQTYPEHCLNLQRVELTLCHTLHQGKKTQKILSGHTKHYTAGR